VVIIADRGSRIGLVTEVMDQIKMAGPDIRISISAEEPGN
jgi:hypothetical protein